MTCQLHTHTRFIGGVQDEGWRGVLKDVESVVKDGGVIVKDAKAFYGG